MQLSTSITEAMENQVVENLTAQEVIDAVRKVFEQDYYPDDWLTPVYVYEQLARHPQRFGLKSAMSLPPYERFRAICRAYFPVEREGRQLYIRCPRK